MSWRAFIIQVVEALAAWALAASALVVWILTALALASAMSDYEPSLPPAVKQAIEGK